AHPPLDGAPVLPARTTEGTFDVRGRPAEEPATRVLFGAQRHSRLVRVAHDRMGEVRVRVDAAGHHDLPGRVDDAPGRERARSSERGDALALDTEVPVADTGRRDDAATTDHEIEHERLLLGGGRTAPARERRL